MKRRLTFLALAIVPFALEAREIPRPVAYVPSAGGYVRGSSNGSVDKFLGIPYAAPPTGDLRWKPPGSSIMWSGIRDATSFGSECVQRRTWRKAVSGSENCLFLNVYRPASAESRGPLPVFIFVHGGSNQQGAGSDFDPSAIAAHGILVVTFNYRLNVFGFLALPSLDREGGVSSSGNFGLMDQHAVMLWVRRNIRAFGGNPFDVTVGGESAGAIDLCALLASPAAAGLFHRAILESFYIPAVNHQQAVERSAATVRADGCSDAADVAACLRGKSSIEMFAFARSAGFRSGPNFGGALLPEEPSLALNAGRWNRSAILLGTNRDEAALPVLGRLAAARAFPFSAQRYSETVKTQFGGLGLAVLDEYPLSSYEDSPFLALSDEETDISPLGCAFAATAQTFSVQARTWRYEFDDRSAPRPDIVPHGSPFVGAYHAGQLQYLFNVAGYSGKMTPEQ